MRHLHEPFTYPVFGKLQTEINDMIIALKIHYLIDESKEDKEKLDAAKAHTMKPTYENIVALLSKIHDDLNQYRDNPIKYKHSHPIF